MPLAPSLRWPDLGALAPPTNLCFPTLFSAVLSTFNCILPMLGHLLGYLRWCGCCLGVAMEWGELRVLLHHLSWNSPRKSRLYNKDWYCGCCKCRSGCLHINAVLLGRRFQEIHSSQGGSCSREWKCSSFYKGYILLHLVKAQKIVD